MAWYEDWFSSPHFDQLYRQQEEATLGFLPDLLAYLKPALGSRLLDAGCGKGRSSRLLANAGYDVNGVDFSMDTINYAQQFEREGLSFSMHDLRLPFWVNYFHGAFHLSPFGYYVTRREHDDVAHTLAASLKTGGWLVLNNPNVHYEEDHMVPHEIRKSDEISFEINRWQDDLYFFKRIIVSGAELQEPQEFTEQWIKLSFGDLNDILAFQKMQVTKIFGDYSLQPYHVRKSPRLIVIARKMG